MIPLVAACEQSPPPSREWRAEDHSQPSQREPAQGADRQRVAPEEAEAAEEGGEARASAVLWNITCARCHGPEGRGDGAEKPTGMPVPDLADAAWQRSRSDVQIAQVIAQGRGAMPGFGQQLTPEGIQALVRHVRRFQDAPGEEAP